MPSKKNIAMDWSKKCADSNGTMVIVPKSMIDESEKFFSKSDEFLNLAREFDKASAEFDLFAKNFWHKMRLSLEEAGIEEVWGKNIGWNERAREDGIKVINIISSSPRPM